MKMNLHTHTPRCHHATGSEREYIERAIAAGLQTLGFSDHAPMPFLGDYYSTFRMRPEETRGYVDTLLALREEYKDRIQILIGFEAEYYPEVFPRFREFIAQFPIDYLLLGQHFLGNEKDSPYSCRKTKDESLFCAYVDQVCEALKTGAYSYLAHPDLMYYDGDEAAFQKHARRLCECAACVNAPQKRIRRWKSTCWVCAKIGILRRCAFSKSPRRLAIRSCSVWMRISRNASASRTA